MGDNKDVQNQVNDATIATMQDLRSVASGELSELSLPEIDSVIDVVSKVIPAGNVPGLIASGLARLQGNNPSEKEIKRDIGMLFRGMNQMFDHAVYNVFFAGPAQIIWGYQNLLKLTGKDPEAAFPEGTWQFYVDYALREDTARHTNETHGFDTALADNNIQLNEIDRMTAWTMTAIQTLHHYHSLLENEWRERVYIRELLDILADREQYKDYKNLFNQWLRVLPYRRMADARGDETYPAYRRRKFDEWLFQSVAELPKALKNEWSQRIKIAKADHLNDYIQQMTIRSFLNPDQYAETRTPVAMRNLHIAIIYGDHYYLIPACVNNTRQANDVTTVRSAIAAIVQQPSQYPPAELAPLAQVQRNQWSTVRRKLPRELVDELSMLRLCPIVLNFNPRNRQQPLAQIRQAERGVGDHALTIFDTRQTFVFDQSHIYFDGAWGAALAEIMTNEALAWASYLSTQPLDPPTERPYSPRFEINQATHDYIDTLAHVIPEVSAENDAIRVKNVLALRRLFKQRSDLLALTVNDLLLLYRALHAMQYQADPDIIAELNELKKSKTTREAAESALLALAPYTTSPAILMPVDASRMSPRERLYPMSFEVPIKELNLATLHSKVVTALNKYEAGGSGATFDKLQRQYLASLAGFGKVMTRAKSIATAGESASVGTIKLLAHMPQPLQHLLNEIPSRFDMLNDIIKGREVFSNVGAVAKSSTLTRFITAKDDNEKKDLAWGVLTDADSNMIISLRDFRPHVKLLIAIGRQDIAQAMTQHYLDEYAIGLNHYVRDVQRITLKSRETRMAKS